MGVSDKRIALDPVIYGHVSYQIANSFSDKPVRLSSGSLVEIAI